MSHTKQKTECTESHWNGQTSNHCANPVMQRKPEGNDKQTNIDITELIELFIADQDVLPVSRKQYDTIICLFFLWAENNMIEWYDLKRSDIIKFKDRLYEDNKSELTIANYIIVVKMFYEWRLQNGYGENIANGIKTPRRYKGFKKLPLTITQIKKLLKAIDTKTLKGKRDFAIINLMLRTGIREIELTRIDIRDISERDGMKFNIQRKGRKSKDLPVSLTDKSLKAIYNYLRERKKWNEDDPLFVSVKNSKRISTQMIRKVIKQYLKQIGIDNSLITAHSLRHSAGSLALQLGASEYQTQMFMGHKDFSTTQLYTRTRERIMQTENIPGKLLDKAF